MTGHAHEDVREGDVAIIGMACRFPGASDPKTFWRNLRDGVESISFPAGPGDPSRPGLVRAGGVLPDIDKFDAAFFGYARHEAEVLDPQHRIFLECAWEALEDAGYDARAYPGAVGVYGGAGISSYLINNVHPGRGWHPDRTFLDSSFDLQLLLASDKDFLTSRVSYKLDLRGPSVTVQAACATSLFAVHFACQALLNGECDLALAGAASIPVPQLVAYVPEPGMVLSPDGHCRAFDARAEGTVLGSGVGMVVLKLLPDAIADNDAVYAVIQGTAVNNDGALKVGITAPSVQGQAAVVSEALSVAGADPETISYVEAHGTGTPLGDPVEVEALSRAFGSTRSGWCALGSVKTNVGHLGWAAGMAGLIKTALALHHRQIPPSLHFVRPNPRIPFGENPFYVNTRLTDWQGRHGAPLRAGVSAFGLGGTNAHVVLTEAPTVHQPSTGPDRPCHVLTLSATSEKAVRQLAGRYEAYLHRHAETALPDIAFTANTGRRHHDHRAAVVAGDHPGACRQLAALAAGASGIGVVDHRRENPNSGSTTPHPRPRLAALFTGHRADYRDIGRQLYEAAPVFRETLDSCAAVLREYLGAPGCDLLYGPGLRASSGGQVAHAQPLLFAVQMSLLRLWQSWGVEPDLLVGHSLGEYAAACAADVFALEDGIHLVAERARLLGGLPGDGAMAVVFADEDQTRGVIAQRRVAVSIAAVNGPANTVVAGHRTALQALGGKLEEVGIGFKELGFGRGGHSSLVDPILDDFGAIVDRVELQPPRLDVVSTVTGELGGDDMATTAYWRRQLREPVRFAAAVRAVAMLGAGAFIEIGPAPVLLGMAGDVLPDHSGPWLPSLRPGMADWTQITTSLGELYAHGFAVDWAAFDRGRPRHRVHLPTYPWQRRRYWVDSPAQADPAPSLASIAGEGLDDLLYEVRWQGDARGAVPRSQPAAGGDLPPHGCWLIFADRQGVGSALAAELADSDQRCSLVYAGDRYERAGEGRYVIDPDDAGHFERLWAELEAPPYGVVHLWSLDTPRLPTSAEALMADPDCAAGAARVGCGSALRVLQTAVSGPGRPPRVWLVTRNVQLVTEGDRGEGVAQSPLWGMTRAGLLEHPELRCVLVDLGAVDEADVSALLGELGAAGDEREVAFRRGLRHLPRLVRRRTLATAPASLREDGSYLVVGGTRGLGLLTAERLVELGARRVVVAGRHHPGADGERRLEALRQRGVDIVIASVDISNAGQVSELLAEIDGAGRPLRGVVHAAATLDDGILRQLGWDRFATVLAPKAQGAWNLHVLTALRRPALDFCVFFSSATSLVGNAGQANYAAANAFLDALSHHRRATGQAALSINWGAWSSAGFLAEHDRTLAHLERIGFGSIDSEQGIAILDRLLGVDDVQVAVLPFDWPRFLPRHSLDGVGFFAHLAGDADDPGPRPDTSFRARATNATVEDRGEMLLSHVREQATAVLGAGSSEEADVSLDTDRSLLDYGLDSLSAIQLRNSLQSSLSCPLPPSLCFDHPTIAAIARYLEDEGLVGARPDPQRATEEAAAATGAPASDRTRSLSLQQQRWLRLLRAGYGRLLIPILFGADLDRERFSEALRAVVGRHEILRWRFDGDEARVLDVEAALPPRESMFVDLSKMDPGCRTQSIAEAGRAARAAMPDPTKDVPWSMRCLKLSSERFLVLLSAQHLEFDGVSISVFVDDLRDSYRRCLAGERPLEDAAPQYREFVTWQARYLRGPVEEDRAFFTGLYSASGGRTLLPGHSGSKATESFPSARITPPVDASIWPRLQEAARDIRVSPFAVLCAVYARLVARIVGRDDVTVGTIVTGRPDDQFRRTIGPFVAPFPVPVHAASRSMAELAEQCNRVVTAINSRCAYPPSDLAARVPPFAGLPMDTYFTDAFIMFNNYTRESEEAAPRAEVLECLAPVAGAELAGLDVPTLAEIAGLFLIIDIWNDQLRFNFWYHLHRFSRAQVATWADLYLELLREGLVELAVPERGDLAALTGASDYPARLTTGKGLHA